MGRRVRILSALVAGTLAFVVGTPTAHALISKDQIKCQIATAKEGANYVNKKLKLIQKCKNADLAEPGSCSLSSQETLDALTKLSDKLLAGIEKKCVFLGSPAANLETMGFPGPCPDSNPGNGFTVADLQACILDTHDQMFIGVCGGGINLGESCDELADCPDSGPGTYCHGLLGTEYDPTVVPTLTDSKLTCQKEYAKNSSKFLSTLLKSVQKCRNGL